jgi:hypothetical protein
MAASSILDIPVDETITFRPTKILYIVQHSGCARDTKIVDLTSQLHDSYHDGFTPEFKASAKQVATSSLPSPPAFTLTQAHWYSNSRLTVTDTTGAQLAEWHSPILSYGVTRIKFPKESPHCSHGLEVKPLSVARRAQSFVKDSSTYVWEGRKRFESGCMSLYKCVAGKKIEVARYESERGGFCVGGPLVVERREVDELVAVLTCMAVLSQLDGFYMPGLDLGSRK